MRWSPSACLPQLGLGAAVAVAVAVAVVVLAFVFVVVHHLGFLLFFIFPEGRLGKSEQHKQNRKREEALVCLGFGLLSLALPFLRKVVVNYSRSK